MTNARDEMLELLKGKEIKCAEITTGKDWCGEYDGSEWWEEHSLSEIPKELLP